MPDTPNAGGRKPRVTDEDLLDVFRSTSDPVLSTAEVADAVPIQRRGTLTRLQRLADAGELARKDIGGRNTVWWLVDDTHDAESDKSGAQGARSPPPTENPGRHAGR